MFVTCFLETTNTQLCKQHKEGSIHCAKKHSFLNVVLQSLLHLFFALTQDGADLSSLPNTKHCR